MNDLTFSQMFSGIDGFRLALERSGWHCVWSNDNDKYACQVSKKNYPDGLLVEGDIREISAKTVPRHTLLTAGFPCQAFSVAGKRKATKDSRGTLFTHIARVAARKRPKLLLLENVKGLLSSESGRTFSVILRTLANLGYLLEWQVLNSKHFGVPQNRERVFLVGHLGGEGGRTIFPIGKTDKNSVTRSTKSPSQNSKSLRVGSHLNARGTYIATSALIQSQGREPHIETRKDKLSHALKGKGGWEGNYIVADRTRTYAGLGRNLESPKLVANALSGVQKDNLLLEHYSPKTWVRTADKDGISPTLTSPQGGGQRNYIPHLPEGLRIRRLTPTECERLQGFPDGWTRGVSDTQRYKLLGNAVTVNVVEFLGRKLRECLKE